MPVYLYIIEAWIDPTDIVDPMILYIHVRFTEAWIVDCMPATCLSIRLLEAWIGVCVPARMPVCWYARSLDQLN
jgi:hypothetical protein